MPRWYFFHTFVIPLPYFLSHRVDKKLWIRCYRLVCLNCMRGRSLFLPDENWRGGAAEHGMRPNHLPVGRMRVRWQHVRVSSINICWRVALSKVQQRLPPPLTIGVSKLRTDCPDPRNEALSFPSQDAHIFVPNWFIW